LQTNQPDILWTYASSLNVPALDKLSLFNMVLPWALQQPWLTDIYPVLDIMNPSLTWNQLRLVKETINVLSQRPAELISMPLSESMLPPC
jgi:hypothetical protein